MGPFEKDGNRDTLKLAAKNEGTVSIESARREKKKKGEPHQLLGCRGKILSSTPLHEKSEERVARAAGARKKKNGTRETQKRKKKKERTTFL